MNKRILSIILVLTMLVGVVAVMPVTVTAANTEVWDGSVADGFAGGTGSKDNPYQISNGAEFAYFAQQVNNGTTTFEGEYIILTSDIILNEGDASGWSESAPVNSFTPIGAYNGDTATDYAFGGNFNGDGHTISGVYVKTSHDGDVGLFGRIQGGTTIKNLALVNSYIEASASGAAGALVGQTNRGNEGSIGISNVYIDAIVDASGNEVGGVIGNISDTNTEYTAGSVSIDSVTFVGTVISTGQYVGGIVGNARKVPLTISNCLIANAKIQGSKYVAGFLCKANVSGAVTQKVSHCIIVNTEVFGSYNRLYVYNGKSTANTKPTIEYCHWYNVIDDKGNAVDHYTNAKEGTDWGKDPINVSRLYGMYTGSDAIKKTGWAVTDYDITRPKGVAENFGILPVEPPKQFANGSGTEEDPYLISDAEQLALLSELSQANTFEDTYFELTADITLEGENNHTPIGAFACAFGGTFDGKGHTISGAHIKNAGDGSGFFAAIQGGATIKNLTLVDAHVESTNKGAVGALVGQTNRANGNDITISNVYVDADVIVANGGEVGGIIGTQTCQGIWQLHAFHQKSIAKNR